MDCDNTSNTMCNTPFISVIVPVYNCEKYIAYCIESILKQTYKNFELIIIDDGSTDLSGAICDGFISDKRVQVYHQNNRGLSYARNLGCEKAVGTHVLFVDSDDYLQNNSLAYFVEIYSKTKADIIVADFFRAYNHRITITNCTDIQYSEINKENAIGKLFSTTHDAFKFGTAWGKMFDINLLKKFPFPVGKLWEDVFILYRLYDDAKHIVFTNEILYFYFQNMNGITGSPFSVHNLDYLDGMIERLQYIKENYAQLYDSALQGYINKCNEFYEKAIAIVDFQLAEDIKNRLSNIEK